MESNEQTELTSKIDIRLTESRVAAVVRGEDGGGGIGEKRKRTHAYLQQCGDCDGEGSIRRLNGNKEYN